MMAIRNSYSIVSTHCCCSVAKSRLTLCDPMNCTTPCSPVLPYLLEFAKMHVHWVGDAIQPSHPLLPSSPFAFNLPSIRVFSNELALHNRWPKCRSFSISPSKEYSGLVSFRINWFDLLDVQGTLKSLFQHQNSSPSILWRSVVLMVQFAHPYMTTGKTIDLTLWTYKCQHGCNLIKDRSYLKTKTKTTILYMCVCVLGCGQLFATPWAVAHKASLSIEFSRQEYWSR